jgi:hypothetical protein
VRTYTTIEKRRKIVTFDHLDNLEYPLAGMDIVDVWIVSSHPDVAENNYTDVPNSPALRLPDSSGSRALIGSRC